MDQALVAYKIKNPLAWAHVAFVTGYKKGNIFVFTRQAKKQKNSND
jgi:hypothetical protein